MVCKIWAALVAAGCLMAAGGASAGVVLDQATIPETGHVDFSGSVGHELGAYAIGQSFTVGISGRLARIDLGVENWYHSTAGVHFDLLDPADHVVFSQDISAAQLPVFGFSGLDWDQTLDLDVSPAGLHVNAGDVYLLKLTGLPTNGPGEIWRASNNNGLIDYAGGQSYEYGLPGFPSPITLGNEFAFRTYVAIPEPASWSLMILGFGVLGGSLRGRRTRVAA